MDEKIKQEPENVTDKKRRKMIAIIVGVTATICIGIIVAVILISYTGRVYKHCVFEAGVEVEARDFLKDTTKDIEFTKDSEKVNTKVPGDYVVKLKSGYFTYKCTATIQDTIPPTGQAVDVFFEEGEKVAPEQFVTNVEDMTEVQVSFVKEPDYSYIGKQPIEVVLTDAGNNTVAIASHLISRITVKEHTIEAGEPFPDMSTFLIVPSEDASFVTAPDTIDMSKPGDYDIIISANGFECTTVLHIQDTIAPVIQVKNITAYNVDKVTCESFIKSAKDATALTYQFVKEPNMKQLGEQQLSFVATDAGGNSVQFDVVLTVIPDTEAPVIKGAKDITAYVGRTVRYKDGVKVTDNHDRNITLNVDTSKVNTKVCGDYPVIYSAQDLAGNKTSISITVHIIERVYTEAEVNSLADKVLASITNSGMSQYQKLQAIYKWTRSSIAYTGSSDKSSWIKAACEGLIDRKGDCYTYASVAKALLNRAGINNKDIVKIPSSTRHYWNLVNIGEGWYHFDTTPRKGQTIDFCYIDDATLMKYSQANGNSHNYDRNIYTDIE